MCFYDLQKAVSSTPEAPLRVGGEWQGLEDLTKLVRITEEHGESEWGAFLTIHIRAQSSSRLCPLPSALLLIMD